MCGANSCKSLPDYRPGPVMLQHDGHWHKHATRSLMVILFKLELRIFVVCFVVIPVLRGSRSNPCLACLFTLPE